MAQSTRAGKTGPTERISSSQGRHAEAPHFPSVLLLGYTRRILIHNRAAVPLRTENVRSQSFPLQPLGFATRDQLAAAGMGIYPWQVPPRLWERERTATGQCSGLRLNSCSHDRRVTAFANRSLQREDYGPPRYLQRRPPNDCHLRLSVCQCGLLGLTSCTTSCETVSPKDAVVSSRECDFLRSQPARVVE